MIVRLLTSLSRISPSAAAITDSSLSITIGYFFSPGKNHCFSIFPARQFFHILFVADRLQVGSQWFGCLLYQSARIFGFHMLRE
ncbi:hypothetical protein P0D69_28060 [Paraburkholderia sediminicola]|uniref:hypothetical protein n=1 Tax=Paraburkholderia sediminicola TaxID=458836 RepID=UPI0038BB1740